MTDIIVNETRLNEYRNKLKSINAHDKDYESIKRDIYSIQQRFIRMNQAHDVAGVFAESTVLAMRLITYGNISYGLSVSDINTMLAPLDAMSEFTKQTFSNTKGVSFVKNAIPIFFGSMVKYEIDTLDKLYKHIRAIVTVTGDLKKDMIAYSLAYGFCLYKYGMVDVRDAVADKAERIVIEQGGDSMETYKMALSIFKSGLKNNVNRFAVGLSIVLSDVNEGKLDYNVSADIMNDIRAEAVKRGHEHDMLDFIDGEGFRAMTDVVHEYYMKENDDEDDDEQSE